MVALENYRSSHGGMPLPTALRRCIIHDSDGVTPSDLEQLAPNHILGAFVATRNGIQSEFRRLAKSIVNCQSPEPWDAATLLAWVYPEGIRLIESSCREYYCYGPFALGDTVKPKNCINSFQLFLGLREVGQDYLSF